MDFIDKHKMQSDITALVITIETLSNDPVAKALVSNFMQ